jgi:hypothetical protein
MSLTLDVLKKWRHSQINLYHAYKAIISIWKKRKPESFKGDLEFIVYNKPDIKHLYKAKKDGASNIGLRNKIFNYGKKYKV